MRHPHRETGQELRLIADCGSWACGGSAFQALGRSGPLRIRLFASEAAEKLAADDVLADGRFSLVQENGLTLEVDWNVPAENMPVAARPWSDPASDPIADELPWIQHLDDIGAPEPEPVVTSRKAFGFWR